MRLHTSSTSPVSLPQTLAQQRVCRPAIQLRQSRPSSSRLRLRAEEPRSTAGATEAKPVEDPAWVKREKAQQLIDAEGGADLPFALYLVAASLVAIAAVGSIYEFTAKHAVFGVIQPDNPLWLPILGLFGLTGLPSAGWLFYKAVTSANKEAERQDKLDGY